MPDITMCDDILCPKARTCYRNMLNGTKPNEYRQSFFTVSPRNVEDDSCEYFWDRLNE